MWRYIREEQIQLPSLYFSHSRKVFNRQGVLFAYADFMQLGINEVVEELQVRFRTIGDMTCTGAVLSEANSIDEIIIEVANATTTERGTRLDDQRSETAMEDRKKQGYF